MKRKGKICIAIGSLLNVLQLLSLTVLAKGNDFLKLLNDLSDAYFLYGTSASELTIREWFFGFFVGVCKNIKFISNLFVDKSEYIVTSAYEYTSAMIRDSLGAGSHHTETALYLYDANVIIGYLLPSIIGCLLLFIGIRRWKKSGQKTEEDVTDKFMNLFTDALSNATKKSKEIGPILLDGQRPNETDYGYSKTNPICSSTLTGTDIYLSKLRTPDGEKFSWQRMESVRADCNGVTDVGMDKYQLYLNDEIYKVLYIVPYVGKAIYPPHGLVLSEKLEDESAIISIKSTSREKDDESDAVTPDTTARNKKQRANKPVKYCSRCGSVIDNESKTCTGCGKQYFKGFKLNKFSITIMLLSFVIILVSILCASQYSDIQELKSEIVSLEILVNAKQEHIDRLKNKIDDMEDDRDEEQDKLDFYDYAVVIVADDGTDVYHKYGCPNLDLSNGYWIYNSEAADYRGYYRCSKCN